MMDKLIKVEVYGWPKTNAFHSKSQKKIKKNDNKNDFIAIKKQSMLIGNIGLTDET